MEQSQYNQIFNFVWNIANDVLVQAFEKGKYKDIIMPMLVLRRLDILLERTKADVLKQKHFLDTQNYPEDRNGKILMGVTGLPYYNTSPFTMKSLKGENNSKRLLQNFIAYLDGFSSDVQDIINKFDLRHSAEKLHEVNRLGAIIEKFTDERINLGSKPVLDEEGNELVPALDNHAMGTLFEELLRKFNEENNVTEAGEHFTPRDYVKLLADLAIEPIIDKITNRTYEIYDGACGTGGILSIVSDKIKEIGTSVGKTRVETNLYGQEIQPDTYATCKADLMLCEQIKHFDYNLNGETRNKIAFGSTISQDGHKDKLFDFCISNPPFGTPWKRDLENWGLSEKEKKNIIDKRFKPTIDDVLWDFVPSIGDPQMLFLANNISRMKEGTDLGTRIVEVHNASSLFTGNAGGGESNLRRYILENDLLEAIVAMPEKLFYNTGIGTFIWVVTNRKEPRRKGKVQLIDATKICEPLTGRNLGEKNCQVNKLQRKEILRLLQEFDNADNSDVSKVFDNTEFGYWEVPVMRPKRDENGNILYKKAKKGQEPEIDYAKSRNESERVPLNYPGGIEAFYKNEVEPYDSEAIFGEPVVGYEISFTKYFYKPVELRSLDEIRSDIRDIEKKTEGMLDLILS